MRWTRIENPLFFTKSRFVGPVLAAVLFLNGGLPFIGNSADAAGSKRISFASKRTGNFDIYVINTDGENLRSLTNHPADERSPAWSPDGQLLAYASNQDGIYRIYVMDTRTREHRRLTNRHEEEWFPAWAPDGQSIAFVSIDHEKPENKELGHAHRSDIYKTEANGENLRQLTNQGTNGRPAWSPDSQWIAFISRHRGNERKGIYMMDADGRRLRRINDKAVQALNGIFRGECSWSPDGKQIAFGMDIPKQKRTHLCVIDTDGKNFRQLTQGGPGLKPVAVIGFPNPLISYPAWSPDGDRIAYSLLEPGSSDIYVINAINNGRGKPLLMEKRGLSLNLYPAWVPEGFLSVSPSAEKQTTLWGKLKQPKKATK